MSTVVLTFVAPPPGLDPLVDFTLDEIEGAAGLYALAAVQEPQVRLYVIDARTFAPDYAPSVPRSELAALGIDRPQEASVLLVACPGPEGITVNVLAPIVVNPRTGAAAQVILDDHSLSVQAPLEAIGA